MSVQSRLWNRVQHMVTFGRTTAAAAETGNVSTVQVRVDDLRLHDDVPVAGMFGFQSSIPPGTDVARVAISGDTSNSIIVATNHIPSRMRSLASGGSRMHDSSGTVDIVMPNSGTIDINANSSVNATTPDMFVTGNLHAGTGATGSFTTPTGQIVSVRDGIIINIF